MVLGKTVQSLGLLLFFRNQVLNEDEQEPKSSQPTRSKPAMIIVPKPILSGWQEVYHFFLNGHTLKLLFYVDEDTKALTQKEMSKMDSRTIIVTKYDLFQTLHGEGAPAAHDLSGTVGILILDESHKCKYP